ncbi:MAG: MazG nucleotide pyrophosphohydrolase domain-containing protein [Acidimicrobiales bacterium]
MTRPRITVCGLGPGGPGSVTTATLAAIERSTVRFVRTTRHPTAHLVPGAASFDHLYEAAESFDEVYGAIADALVAAAAAAAASGGTGDADGAVLYAVPGSPLVLEDSVRRLRADPRVDIELMPALSFLDEAWARLGVDPVDDGVRLIDGHRFAVEAAGERGPLLVAHVHAPWVLSDIKLALDAGDEQRAVVLQGLGTPEERVFEVAWPDLDRMVTPDHLTSLYLPELAAPVAAELAASVELMARLRRDCPWDRAQTHRSLRRYLLEEAYEVLEAIDRLPTPSDGQGQEGSAPDELDADDGYELLEEELGDLWFQVLFHAQLAAEAGRFTVADVARTLHDKLVGRHPHVFGDVAVADAGEVVANWERIKQEEKQRSSALDGIPAALPALSLADKVLQRAERAGWTIDIGELGRTVAGLVPPGASSEELGRVLLALVVAGRAGHLDAEAALRSAVVAAEHRFRQAEASGTRTDSWVLG